MTKEKDNFAEVAKRIEEELQMDAQPVAAQPVNGNDMGAAVAEPAVATTTVAPPAPAATRTAKGGKRAAGGYQLKYSAPMKIISFVCFLLMAVVASASVVGLCAMLENGFYTQTEIELKEAQFESIVDGYVSGVVESMVADTSYKTLDAYCAQNNISVQLFDADGTEILSNTSSVAEEWSFRYQNISSGVSLRNAVNEDVLAVVETVSATLVISFTPDSTWSNSLSIANALIEHGYANRYFIILNILLSVVIGIALFFHLLQVAGRSPREHGVVLSEWTSVPLDLLTLFTILIATVPVICWYEFVERTNQLTQWQVNLLGGVFALVYLIIATLYLMNLAARCKAGKIWRNTMVYSLCAVLWRGATRFVRWAGTGCGRVFAQLPFIWKGAVLVPIVMLFNLLCFLFCMSIYAWQLFVCVMIVELIALIAAYLYCLIMLNNLAEGGRAIAKGDLDYQVDTKNLCFEFKTHAENLNQMGSCLTEAVNDQLKSERMKTELITNVSHDIKTPLTSLINYADLLSKVETDDIKIIKYTEVIARQSERLKRLIDDLVEASKASTGSLEVDLQPCEVGVLLSQAVGEYQQRLAEQSLELVAKSPEQSLSIMADGRHLWRVFDNLLNNIYKYALGGTRVYLNLEQRGNQAVITFKNISKYPLDISVEELMERFVRGDASRHNEGNGLGLSIAQSLTELQGGNLTLHVDGDLFKVELTFDLVAPAAE